MLVHVGLALSLGDDAPMILAASLTIDGKEAVARVAYRLSEVIGLYPITPATSKDESTDAWAAGALATNFTVSQGLLLMLPNLYRWAGELRPVAPS